MFLLIQGGLYGKHNYTIKLTVLFILNNGQNETLTSYWPYRKSQSINKVVGMYPPGIMNVGTRYM